MMSTKRTEPENIHPHFASGFIKEPLIIFGKGRTHVDPKMGLALYGPYSSPEIGIPSIKTITVGIVATAPMIADISAWLEACQGRLMNNGENHYLNPHFPGFNEAPPFECQLIFGDTWSESIEQNALKHALQHPSFHTRIDKVIKLFIEKIESLSQREPKPNVIVCGMSKEIIDMCTIKERHTNKRRKPKETKIQTKQRKMAEAGQLLLEGMSLEEESLPDTSLHENLRRGLKAEAMRYGIATQIVQPPTLALTEHSSRKTTQDVATRAWNFCTALYYKAGGTPWRLDKMDPDVCFVGISFYKDLRHESTRMRTSMAQTFTSTGDGYVLRGNSFKWDKSQSPSPHLSKNDAKALLTEVLSLYARQNQGRFPGRIVIHKSSRFWKEELEGFASASQEVPVKDFIALGNRKIQFYRQGQYPVLRGTYIKFSDEEFSLYTTGYVPYFETYRGARVPQPTDIIQHVGDSPWNKILKEIMSLTKMNWNTADFACHAPITIAFSRRVGEILAELQTDTQYRSEYRYYM